MKKRNIISRFGIIVLLACLFAGKASAQFSKPDTIQTKKGNLLIQPVFHAALVLNWDNITIYVDPYNGAAAYKGFPLPDIILITDIHGDHMDTTTLNALNTSKAIFVVPAAVEAKLPQKYKARVAILDNDKTIMEAGIPITAVPMYNLPEDATSRHTKGRGNGYVLSLGGKRIYISGDTEDIPEMRSLKNIDVAFVCMNQPYTMTIEQAASAVLEFRPTIAYPYHYRNQNGFSDTEAFKKLVNDQNSAIEVRTRDWYRSK